MRYDAEQVDYLAAEYVLGTLRGPARRRFVRLMTDRADIRFAVWRWERHLNDIASGLTPHRPRRRVWKNIQRRIELSRTRPGVLQRWRGLWLALPTAIAAAWLAIVLLPTPTTDRVAVFADQNAETLWVISADLDTGMLRSDAITVPEIAAGSSYELWVLPSDGPPQSLGLLPVSVGSVETRISPQLNLALAEAGRLAISLEPSGGSPTGQPTGPVVYLASLVSI